MTVFLVFFKEPLLVSTQEKRNLASFKQLEDTAFLDGSFQKTLDNALADQFLFRYEIVRIKSVIDMKMSQLFIPISNNEYKLASIAESVVKRVGSSNYLINGLMEYSEDYKNRFLNRVDQINKLAEDYPEIDIYVYKPTQVHETDIFDMANDTKSFGTFYRDILASYLKVPYAELQIRSLSDYKNNFYQSDHHWNYQGSYQGYVDIVKLIFNDDEELLQPTYLYTYDNALTFSGTFSSRTGYILPGEPFYIYTFDLPKYKVYGDGKEMKIFDMNTFDDNLKDRDSDYFYAIAYKTYGTEVVYESEFEDKDTLLLIGDSYSAAIEPLLMQHFSKIYYIQPHDYYLKYNKRFSYDDFIANHKVDKILFMYTVENYFYSDEYGDRGGLFDIYRTKGD